MKTNKLIAMVLVLVLAVCMLASCQSNKVPVIGISQYGEHPSLDNCRTGAFEDWELEGARRAVVSALRATMDAQGRLEDYWMGQAVAGLEESPQDLVDRVEAVTREQVVAVAKKMELDTIYFLKGKED